MRRLAGVRDPRLEAVLAGIFTAAVVLYLGGFGTGPARLALKPVPALVLAVWVSACSSAAADEPRLLNELATRLDRAGDLTFTAEYRLDGGSRAVLAQAQQPRRAAYVHPGGKAVFTES